MEINRKQVCIISDTRQMSSYFRAASVFRSAVYAGNGSFYSLLEDNYISEINSDDRFFVLNSDIDFTVEKNVNFRVLLESCVVDFTAELMQTARNGKKFRKFSLPEMIHVSYMRRFMRVHPAKYYPLKVVIPWIDPKDSLKTYSVSNLSVRGMGVTVQNADLLFRAGDMLEGLEVSLPGQDNVTVSGQVKFVRGDICGIRFLPLDDRAERLIREYVAQRMMMEKLRDDTLKNAG